MFKLRRGRRTVNFSIAHSGVVRVESLKFVKHGVWKAAVIKFRDFSLQRSWSTRGLRKVWIYPETFSIVIGRMLNCLICFAHLNRCIFGWGYNVLLLLNFLWFRLEYLKGKISVFALDAVMFPLQHGSFFMDYNFQCNLSFRGIYFGSFTSPSVIYFIHRFGEREQTH